MGKATGSRECAPDDRLRVPTNFPRDEMVGTAQARLCPPYEKQKRAWQNRARFFLQFSFGCCGINLQT
ncbi:hypothetical protein [Afipia sp. GAS231]|uniref:hypothetical protein n=1 Tax=Afipia sp. GAS231 TaxID=1882747 RepID=UPI00087D4AFC|nr:hypothetical protein [Afipia sp. GAS231]SDN63687.1 hypothetical protein SAMN05444050_2042 [Afipia sp. GAS231]